DGVLNQDESDIDCGGSCDACGEGTLCTQPFDCADRVCTDGVCIAPDCEDTVHNGAETDVDCGGGSDSGCGPCEIGEQCQTGGDCVNEVCTDGICQAAECVDETLNGDETDVDCGGSCARC